jgi:hypothetical protein
MKKQYLINCIRPSTSTSNLCCLIKKFGELRLFKFNIGTYDVFLLHSQLLLGSVQLDFVPTRWALKLLFQPVIDARAVEQVPAAQDFHLLTSFHLVQTHAANLAGVFSRLILF